MDGAFFLTFANQRWLSIRLDVVGICMVFVCAILVVTSRFDVSPSISGLVLSYILAIGQMLQFTIRQLAEVENNMNATERLHYYGTQLEEEAPEHLGEVHGWQSSRRTPRSSGELFALTSTRSTNILTWSFGTHCGRRTWSARNRGAQIQKPPLRRLASLTITTHRAQAVSTWTAPWTRKA